MMDVGCVASVEEPIYRPLLDLGLGHLHACAGDARQIEAIKTAYGNRANVHQEFLFDGSVQKLHITSETGGMTSLLKPRQAALKFFNGFEGFGAIEAVANVQTSRLDDLDTLPCIDLLKMDIQGAELTVLQNGMEKLADCVAIQLEVSYVCLYENQPSFGDVDVWMRAQGYAPHKFLDVKRRSIAPTIFNNNFRIPGNQLLESDIVYIRDPLALDKLTDVQVQKMAVIAHYCLQSYDLCVFTLLELIKRGHLPDGHHLTYLQELSEQQAS
jgi:FkbM family methyltransferase